MAKGRPGPRGPQERLGPLARLRARRSSLVGLQFLGGKRSSGWKMLAKKRQQIFRRFCCILKTFDGKFRVHGIILLQLELIKFRFAYVRDRNLTFA